MALFHSHFTNSWNSSNRYHFCICRNMYTLFAPYSSSYSFPYHLSPPSGANPHWAVPVLRYCFLIL
jgi:hypothetical protein